MALSLRMVSILLISASFPCKGKALPAALNLGMAPNGLSIGATWGMRIRCRSIQVVVTLAVIGRGATATQLVQTSKNSCNATRSAFSIISASRVVIR